MAIERDLGSVGFSQQKLASMQNEITTEVGTRMNAYIDECMNAEIAQNRKVIEGKETRFGIPFGVTKVKDYLLYNSELLTSINLNGCEEVGAHAFDKCNYITSINVKNAKIRTLGAGAFCGIGSRRNRPSANVLTMDFRKSSFSYIGKNTFGDNDTVHKLTYTDIYLPKTVSQIANYAFERMEHCNLYLSGAAPQLFGSYAFSNINDCVIYVSWRGLYDYKNATNWSSVNTVGCSLDDDFEAGETLPEYTQNGYPLSWFSDSEMTTAATVADGESMYYCSVGDTKMANQVKTRIEHATLLIKDTNNNIYDEDHPIPFGVTVTITVVPDEGYDHEFIFTANGDTIISGDTWLSEDGGDALNIICIYYDGENAPVDPVFENNAPSIIAALAKKGILGNYFELGTTFSLDLSDGKTVEFRYVDPKVGRYQYANGSGNTNAVFMMTKIYYEKQMNSSNTNVGGFAASAMNTNHLRTIYALLPPEWKEVIPEIRVTSCYSGTDGTLATASCHLFIPSTYELSGGANNARSEEQDDIFGWYSTRNTNADRIMYDVNGNAKNYWTRSPLSGNTSYFVYVTPSGGFYNNNSSYTVGVPVCFCL